MDLDRKGGRGRRKKKGRKRGRERDERNGRGKRGGERDDMCRCSIWVEIERLKLILG